MRSKADKAYLANKHKGGWANAKGGLYEDFYAVYQIISCIAKYKAALDGVALQTQLEDTFVDDLLITHPDKNVYHQLKNTKSLTPLPGDRFLTCGYLAGRCVGRW